MSWAFKFTKNVHMYSNRLECKSGKTKFYCQSEDSALEDNVILFWLDEVPLKSTQLTEFTSKLEAWCIKQGFSFKIYLNNNCLVAV